MEKVYCKNCKFHKISLNLIKTKIHVCGKFSLIDDDYYLNKHKKFLLCSFVNSNNDCKDFEAKLSHNFYKYIRNLYNNFK